MSETFHGKPCRNCGGTLRYTHGSKQCAPCKDAARIRWRNKRTKENRSDYWGAQYGLQKNEANLLLEKQNNKCAICKNISDKWHIDHCHSTGKVRGILCPQCNLLLGNAKDNINILINAIQYLK